MVYSRRDDERWIYHGWVCFEWAQSHRLLNAGALELAGRVPYQRLHTHNSISQQLIKADNQQR